MKKYPVKEFNGTNDVASIGRRRLDILDRAEDLGVRIIPANFDDNNRIAIHLLNPSLSEIENALEQAERDNFPLICVHSSMSWPTENE
jgi:hypothetical protein